MEILAEEVRFELTVGMNPRRFSRPALNRSATLPEMKFYHKVYALNKIYSTNISS